MMSRSTRYVSSKGRRPRQQALAFGEPNAGPDEEAVNAPGELVVGVGQELMGHHAVDPEQQEEDVDSPEVGFAPSDFCVGWPPAGVLQNPGSERNGDEPAEHERGVHERRRLLIVGAGERNPKCDEPNEANGAGEYGAVHLHDSDVDWPLLGHAGSPRSVSRSGAS